MCNCAFTTDSATDILLTTDGRGKEMKEKALEFLLKVERERAYEDGYTAGWDEGFQEGNTMEDIE